MKRLRPFLLLLAISAGGLAACATDEAYYGPPPPYADVDYDAFYDGYYGPFYGGYWGPGGSFYYWNADHQHYHRDVGGHFQHQARPGMNVVHGHAPAARAGGAGGRVR